MLTNSVNRYGLVSRFIHWAMALLILGMIGVGAYMTELAKEDPLRAQLYSMHKAVGVTLLGLAFIRILWTLVSRPPLMPAALQRWEVVLAKSTVGLLYILMLAAPVAGYLLANTGGKPVSYFGLFDLPAVMAKNHNLHEVLEDVHGFLGYTILTLVGLHFAGALKHRFIDRDPDADVLDRML